MEKVRRYALFLPLALFILAILLLTGLYETMSVWLIITVIIIIPAIIVFLIPKEPSELEEEEEREEQSTRLSRTWANIQGILAILVIISVPIIIVLAAWWPMIGPIESLAGFNGAKKTFGPEEFRSEAICSGGCQVDGTGVTLAYGGSIYLNGSENMSIRRILITPKSLPEGTIIQTFFGPYEFRMTVQEKTYRGDIFLNGEDISDQTCVNVDACLPERIGTSGVPIIIGTNQWDIAPFGWLVQPKPYIKIKRDWYQEVFDTNYLVKSYGKDKPVRGKVVIASVPGGGIVKIKEVKIY